jgi:hypothetical protein
MLPPSPIEMAASTRDGSTPAARASATASATASMFEPTTT